MSDVTYISSEELQRHNRDVFASQEAEKQQGEAKTEKDKLKLLLSSHIAKYSKTKDVRKMAKENKNVEKYGADYQLDLSADIVEILEKIKNELR